MFKRKYKSILYKLKHKQDNFLMEESKYYLHRVDVIKKFSNEQSALLNKAIKDIFDEFVSFEVGCELREVINKNKEKIYNHYLFKLNQLIYDRMMIEMDKDEYRKDI